MRFVPAMVLGTCLAILSATAAFAQAPQAVLMAVDGEVSVIHTGGVSARGLFGMHLNGGDELRTGADASADIMFASGNLIHLGANSNLTIQGAPATSIAEDSPEDSGEFDSVQNFMQLGEGSVLAGLRGGASGILVALAPCADPAARVAVRESRPRFQWRGDAELGELQLTVFHEGTKIWQGTVDAVDGLLMYPADAPALQPGNQYSWELETTDPLLVRPAKTQRRYFTILGPEERSTLDQALASLPSAGLSQSGEAFFRASLFYRFHLLPDAITTTESALSEFEDNRDLQRILARLYWEADRKDEALALVEQLPSPH